MTRCVRASPPRSSCGSGHIPRYVRLEGVHGFLERRIIIFRALERFQGRQRGIILLTERRLVCRQRVGAGLRREPLAQVGFDARDLALDAVQHALEEQLVGDIDEGQGRCLAEQAKILVAEAEENNLGAKAKNERWERWAVCSLCEQQYHGAVCGALGWACWKTYVGRLETDRARQLAMSLLGSGLHEAEHYAEALSVKETELSTLRRLGASQDNILIMQSNLANTYSKIGRFEEALRMDREVYAGFKLIFGNCHNCTLTAANNLVFQLLRQRKHAEAVSILREPLSEARRAFGDDHEHTLQLSSLLADSLVSAGTSPTLDDVREAIAIREDVCKRSRRLLGESHPASRRRQDALDGARNALALVLSEG